MILIVLRNNATIIMKMWTMLIHHLPVHQNINVRGLIKFIFDRHRTLRLISILEWFYYPLKKEVTYYRKKTQNFNLNLNCENNLSAKKIIRIINENYAYMISHWKSLLKLTWWKRPNAKIEINHLHELIKKRIFTCNRKHLLFF